MIANILATFFLLKLSLKTHLNALRASNLLQQLHEIVNPFFRVFQPATFFFSPVVGTNLQPMFDILVESGK